LDSLTFKNKNNINPWNSKMSPSQIGCALSHIKIYKKFINTNSELAFILEDDAIFLEDFGNKIKNLIIKNFKYKKQIMLLSELKEFYPKAIDTTDGYEIVNVTNAFFTHGYIINKEAAKAIISFNFPVKTVADNFVFFNIYCGVKITGLNPFLLKQDTINFKTSIFWEKRDKKVFLFKRTIFKIKNKILKKFISFKSHKN
jgi:glycosyl transferase family 25